MDDIYIVHPCESIPGWMLSTLYIPVNQFQDGWYLHKTSLWINSRMDDICIRHTEYLMISIRYRICIQ